MPKRDVALWSVALTSLAISVGSRLVPEPRERGIDPATARETSSAPRRAESPELFAPIAERAGARGADAGVPSGMAPSSGEIESVPERSLGPDDFEAADRAMRAERARWEAEFVERTRTGAPVTGWSRPTMERIRARVRSDLTPLGVELRDVSCSEWICSMRFEDESGPVGMHPAIDRWMFRGGGRCSIGYAESVQSYLLDCEAEQADPFAEPLEG